MRKNGVEIKNIKTQLFTFEIDSKNGKPKWIKAGRKKTFSPEKSKKQDSGSGSKKKRFLQKNQKTRFRKQKELVLRFYSLKYQLTN